MAAMYCTGPHSGFLPAPARRQLVAEQRVSKFSRPLKASETTSYLPIQGSIILSPTLPDTNLCFTWDIAPDNVLKFQNLSSIVALAVPGYHLMPSR